MQSPASRIPRPIGSDPGAASSAYATRAAGPAATVRDEYGTRPNDTRHYGPQRSATPTRSSIDQRGTNEIALSLPAQADQDNLRARRATRFLAMVGAIGGVVLGLTIQAVFPLTGTLSNLIYAVSVLAASIGTYGVLILLLLIARLPVLERAIGQDHLVTWHKRIAPWSMSLVFAHIILVVTSYGMDAKVNWFAEMWSLVTKTPWILPALAGTAAIIAAGYTSWKRVRRTIKHETWWTIHLYTYLGIALAFAHQITSGGPFLSGWSRAMWIGLYVAVFGAIIAYRVVLPIVRSLRHDLKVAMVVQEAPGVTSVWVRGRRLAGLGASHGQFFNWRFLHPGLGYEAHPYSISAIRGDMMRITVKALGDASATMAQLPAGTRVLVEGPYGAVTPGRVAPDGEDRTRRTVLIAGGVGIGPVVALAERLAGEARLDVIYRAGSMESMAHRDELWALQSHPGVKVHLMPGHRHAYPLSPEHLRATVGRLDDAQVYVCGPATLNEQVVASARQIGARPANIHHEVFDL
ncbi:Predicted ferric reductase [Raineyella antarctica]|uniref:Predicted ferric reductase n=1 Tax=Raineyella antarctica TaxID=1577474 RepID=A0A1G6H8L4_9ACTN|nr:ferredoxin reductase family protein [Raineyella antarctica]SDB90629.1 Predicted ferric reductase [Raineyella antarctica]